MKLKHIFPVLVFLGMISACGQQPSAVVPSDYEYPSYVSAIEKENCCLCGERPDHILSSCWGQDNIGLVNVNTFDVCPVRINLYGYDGQQIKEAQGHAMLGIVALGGTTGSIWVDPDRGDAHIDISEGGAIDPEAIGTFLCQSCLDAFGERLRVRDTPAEIVLVNFATRELRPLAACYPWFTFGNYAVDCDFQEDGGIDLLIYYSPPRFQEEEGTLPARGG